MQCGKPLSHPRDRSKFVEGLLAHQSTQSHRATCRPEESSTESDDSSSSSSGDSSASTSSDSDTVEAPNTALEEEKLTSTWQSLPTELPAPPRAPANLTPWDSITSLDRMALILDLMLESGACPWIESTPEAHRLALDHGLWWCKVCQVLLHVPRCKRSLRRCLLRHSEHASVMSDQQTAAAGSMAGDSLSGSSSDADDHGNQSDSSYQRICIPSDGPISAKQSRLLKPWLELTFEQRNLRAQKLVAAGTRFPWLVLQLFCTHDRLTTPLFYTSSLGLTRVNARFKSASITDSFGVANVAPLAISLADLISSKISSATNVFVPMVRVVLTPRLM